MDMDAFMQDPKLVAFVAAQVQQGIEAANKAKGDPDVFAHNPNSTVLKELAKITRAAVKTHTIDIDIAKGK